MKKLSLFLLISIISVFVAFFLLSPSMATNIILNYGYWFILSVFSLFLFFLFKSLQPCFSSELIAFAYNKKFIFAALIILVATLFSRVHEPAEFKMLMDEANLTSVGTTMHLKRQAMVGIRGHTITGNYSILSGYVDKRPLLFPFLISATHDLTGYRATNVFYLNIALTVIFFTLLFIFVFRLAGYYPAIFSILLWLNLPLFHWTVNSAGFELLNLVMILTSMLVASAYIKNPSNKYLLSLLCLSAVLLSQVRYESTIYILPVALVILFAWRKTKQISTSWVFFITPLLFVPYIFQHQAFKLNDAFWQLNDIPAATTPFSFKYFYDNLGHAFNFFFSFNPIFPNSPFVAILGMIAVGLFVFYVYKQLKNKEGLTDSIFVFLSYFLGFAIYSLIILVYFYGQLDHVIIHRLALPFFLCMILCTAWWFNHQPQASFKKVLFALATANLILFTIPIITLHQYSNLYVPTKEASWIMDYAKNNPEPKLVISDRSTIWAINQVDTIPVTLANKRKNELKFYMSQPFSPKVFVNYVSLYDPVTKVYNRCIDLDKDFVLALRQEIFISEFFKLEMHEVTDILNVTEELSLAEADPDFSAQDKYLYQWAKNLP